MVKDAANENEARTTALAVEHITVTPKGDRFEITCSKCETGMETGASFGGIPADVMLAGWVTQHVKSKEHRA